MDTFVIIYLLGLLEVVALFVVLHLWTKRRMRIVPRLFWSIVLLVPALGLLMYGFIQINPDRNPERMETQSDRDSFSNTGYW